MKDSAKLLVYFATVIVLGALLAPWLFWGAQWLTAQGSFPSLAKYDFEVFFRRAVLLAAIALLWPLLRALGIRTKRELDLTENHRWLNHAGWGFFLAAIPLLCFALLLAALHVYGLRDGVAWKTFSRTIAATAFVPLIEEAFFRGLVLGVLLRSKRPIIAIIVTSALFSVVHFLKAPPGTTSVVTWTSGFNSIAQSLSQFNDPALVVSAFLTLFVIGLILADARMATHSLWLPIGLHAGWIFANGTFNAIARPSMVILPWLGRNLLVGIAPLGVSLLTWALIRSWLRYEDARRT